eukprot:gene2682-3104_t
MAGSSFESGTIRPGEPAAGGEAGGSTVKLSGGKSESMRSGKGTASVGGSIGQSTGS